MLTGAKKTAIAISGMRNNACRERVARALERVRGVHDVNVSLIRARASVLHDPACEPDHLINAVSSAGYGAALDDDCS